MYESYAQQLPWYVELWRWWTAWFRGDWPEVAIGVAFGLFALFMLAVIASGVFYAADRWFTPRQQGPGRITKRWIIEGHYRDDAYTDSEWGFHWSNGKYQWGHHFVTKYRKVWVEPQPMVEVELINEQATMEFPVDQGAYDVAGMQRPVSITFQRGRFTGTPYIDSYVSA